MSEIFLKLNSDERLKIVCALMIYSEYLEKKGMFNRSDEVDSLRNVILDAKDIFVYQ